MIAKITTLLKIRELKVEIVISVVKYLWYFHLNVSNVKNWLLYEKTPEIFNELIT